MADLANVWTFYENHDAHSDFLHRVAAATIETALTIREETPPEPVTGLWAARQAWAACSLGDPLGAASNMLPGLAVKANDAGLLSEDGEITATDSQIRSTVAGIIDTYSGYFPPAP